MEAPYTRLQWRTPRSPFARRLAPFIIGLISLLVFASGCGGDPESASIVEGGLQGDDRRALMSTRVFEPDGEFIDVRPAANPDRNAYFGDLHVHTTYSFDAYSMGTMATPHDAYRFARGEALAHPGGFDMQLDQPLDFYAVTDHAMFLGVARAMGDTSTEFSKNDVARPVNGLNAPGNNGLLSLLPRLKSFANVLPSLVGAIMAGEIDRETTLDITRAAWQDTIDAAELFNDPGRFTTFIAYEYTTSDIESGNLHRNVIFKGGERIPAVPFSRFHSVNPEDLWAWMDELRGQGVESLAIPHNSNGSNGQMFKLVDYAGKPIDDAYATQRVRNEPLVEITQIKGTSETHPQLSAEDEWADFEIMNVRVATMLDSAPEGSYVRDALRRGLMLESQGVENPYVFGFIGSSDTHTGASQNDESDYVSKLGLLSELAELRGSVPVPPLLSALVGVMAPSATEEIEGSEYIRSATPTYGASGLAAVWAEENTRDAIYEAFRRKETFATSGPRIRLRFFAGAELDESLLDAPDGIAQAYATGVSMGSELEVTATGEPRFWVQAVADPQTVPLQRLQIIKGWIDSSGETHERVHDVACSGGALVDPSTQRCPDNGATVDLDDCSTSGEGAGELAALWRDPGFEETERAFYYARVLENPTCRWSTWDAIRAGVEPRPDLAATIQERAWSSPIQLHPAR